MSDVTQIPPTEIVMRRRQGSNQFAGAMRGSALIFAALGFLLLSAPRLMLGAIGMQPDLLVELIVAHVGGLFCALSFLCWRGRRIVARRAQAAIGGGVVFAMGILGALSAVAVAKGALPPTFLIITGLELGWAAWMLLILRIR